MEAQSSFLSSTEKGTGLPVGSVLGSKGEVLAPGKERVGMRLMLSYVSPESV